MKPRPKAWLRRAVRLAVLLAAAGSWSRLPAQSQVSRRLAIAPPTAPTRLTRLDPGQTGIGFTNRLRPEFAAENQIRMNGSGVAAGDIDGDGRCDLFFCAVESAPRLYRNLGGWRFEDVTEKAGLELGPGYTTGAVFADLDGDGDLDLLVNTLGGGTREFLNDGKGHFAERTDAGLLRKFGAMSLALADVDGDGDLDLYVANYRTTTIRSTGFSVLNAGGRRMIRPEDREQLEFTPEGLILEQGEPDQLYLNDGTGRFTAVAWDSGVFLDESGQPPKQPPRDWGQSALFRDIDGDGSPDLYVCNDFHTPDRIWLNDGKGRFRAMPGTAVRCTPTFSMSVDFADVDRDGHDDFFVADMLDPGHAARLRRSPGMMAAPGDFESAANRPQNARNVLQMGRGDGTFADAAYQYGVAATGWTWSAAFLDVDLDGYEDLLMTGGNLFDTQDLDANARIAAGGPYRREMIPGKLLKYDPLPGRHQLHRNLAGRGFEEVGAAWGFAAAGVSHGMCLADLDGDGDLDVAINTLNGPAAIYRNHAAAPRVAVRLKGAGANTHGIGARVVLRGGAVPMQAQEMISGGRYLSGDDAIRTFAAGTNAARLELEVLWRDGRRTVLDDIKPDHEYTVAEDVAQPPVPRPVAARAPLFAGTALPSVHRDEPFDDFERQGLLPRKLSQLGPGVGWMDVDGDGRDDIVASGGRGGRLQWLRNDGKGGFEPREGPAAERDQTAVAWWPAEGGGRVVYGTSNYEDASNLGGGAEAWSPGNAPEKVVRGPWGASGPLAIAEVAGDGTLVVAIGTRVRAGRFPESDGVRFAAGNPWRPDPANADATAGAGMASGLLWTDLDGDGFPELVLATDWGAPKVYRNDKGRLTEADWGLGAFQGHWNGVAAGDFDGDGRMDLVATNQGLNTRRRAERLYWGDLAGLGQVETIEAEPEGGRWMPVRDWAAASRVLPWTREKFASNRAWSEATVDDVLAGRAAKVLEASWQETTVFLNRGGRFERATLPAIAQRAVGYGVAVGDLDGDGREDVLLVGNDFGPNAADSRADAWRGLWLKGDGKGGFEAIEDAGLAAYGEGRGCALGDFDGDGRVDAVIGQNRGPALLCRNVGARRGLRVALSGRGQNRLGYGAAIRVEYDGGRLGPAREVHGGGGYWSQDAATQVMGLDGAARAVRVRWPGGRETRTELPAGTWECRIDAEGRLAK